MCFVEQKTFSVIVRIFLTNAPPLWFRLYFGLQKCWRWQFLLKIIEDFKCFIMCFVEQKTFSAILRIFLTNAPPLLFPLYFGLQKCWRWQFLLKIVEEDGENVYAGLKVIIMCFVEQKTFSVILRIFLTNAPPLWFPLYFGLQKCWRWQFLLKIDEEYGYSFYTDLKCFILCFVEQKTFSVILRIFLTNAPPLWSPFDNFYSKSFRSMAKIFIQI